MKSEFLLAFNQICSERNLSKDVVLEALQAALVSAYRRNINASTAQNVVAKIDGTTGLAKIFVEKEVVEKTQDQRTEVNLAEACLLVEQVKLGDMIMVESTPEDFGRIAAQTAKQVILQRIREAERDALYNNFSEREGEIINGTVQSVTGQGVTLNLGRTEAILPKNQQVPGERYSVHQRLRAYVLEVRKTPRGPQIIVSRNHKSMLKRLLELEVPEIYNGAVEIKSIAREAGARSKIAVFAKQTGVDPVGSCVGMKGVRIQSIVNELGGEKIDVIEWNADVSVFIQKALSPARVMAVFPDDDPIDGKSAIVIVPDDQLSLAIGREGQNARLAAKLTGWKIDIKSASEAGIEAVRRVREQELAARLPENAQSILPTAEAVVQRHSGQVLPWNAEELYVLRQVVEALHKLQIADRQASRAARAAAEQVRTSKPAHAAEHVAEIQAMIARIPPAAFETQLAALGLSPRVLAHLEKSSLVNTGQVLQRLAGGDEAMLLVEGIGPKALTEIKAQIEAKGLGFLPPPAPIVTEPVEAPADQATAAGAPAALEAVATAATVEVEAASAEPVALVAETAAVQVTPPAAGAPAGSVPAEPAAVAPVAEPAAPDAGAPGAIPGIAELVEEEDEEGGQGSGKKKDKKKARKLVFDERSGAVVAQREHKASRKPNVWDVEEE